MSNPNTMSKEQESEPLTLESIREALGKLNRAYLPVQSIEFSECDGFIDILKHITPNKPREQVGAIDLLYGIPILKRYYVPKDEVWFRGNYGALIKRFKFN